MRITDFLEKIIPKLDKLKHDYIGVWMTLIFIPFILLNLGTWIPFLICLVVAISNEIYQKKTKTGEFEVKDVAFTMHSPTIVFIITLLYTYN